MNGREWIHALWLKPWILEARAQVSLQYNRFLVLDSPVVPEDALGYSYFGRSLAALPGGRSSASPTRRVPLRGGAVASGVGFCQAHGYGIKV